MNKALFHKMRNSSKHKSKSLTKKNSNSFLKNLDSICSTFDWKVEEEVDMAELFGDVDYWYSYFDNLLIIN